MLAHQLMKLKSNNELQAAGKEVEIKFSTFCHFEKEQQGME